MHHHKMHPYMNMQTEPQQADEQMAQESEPLTQPEETRDTPAIEDQTAELEKAREELEKAKTELAESRLRDAAEKENFKKRLLREHEEKMRFASEKVLSDLLPALDNLDLALQYGSKSDACADMVQGIEMTRKQLLEAVAKSGLEAVGERGEQFNPEIHEAIGVEAAPDLENGAVSRVLQRGYKLNNRLMRPAKVMVNNQ